MVRETEVRKLKRLGKHPRLKSMKDALKKMPANFFFHNGKRQHSKTGCNFSK